MSRLTDGYRPLTDGYRGLPGFTVEATFGLPEKAAYCQRSKEAVAS